MPAESENIEAGDSVGSFVCVGYGWKDVGVVESVCSRGRDKEYTSAMTLP